METEIMTIFDNTSTWTTGDEIEYLNRISTFGAFRPEDRRRLLLGYQEAVAYRRKSERYLDMGRIREKLWELLNE
jgi:hypothetical protein